MRHVTVYAQDGQYCGWPANHGAWQWGDEFLVGFLIGEHVTTGLRGAHNVRGKLTKLLARSRDGGETWEPERPNLDFEGRESHIIPKVPYFDLMDPDTIIRVCGDYDHGGEKSARQGSFYLSRDRGHHWMGPFPFNGIDIAEEVVNTSRTCVIENKVFLSFRKKHAWGSDWTFVATHDGDRFKPLAIVAHDNHRAVMPAVARYGATYVCAIRRHGREGYWIDSYISVDECRSWDYGGRVGSTGVDNGNPPAIICANEGAFYCAYGNRKTRTIEVARSYDGSDWQPYLSLRQGNANDIGYPRLFKRRDGLLVCVYYWADKDEDAQRIEATIF